MGIKIYCSPIVFRHSGYWNLLSQNPCFTTTEQVVDGPRSLFPKTKIVVCVALDHLRPPRCHPGSQGKGLLITNMNPFLEVNSKVKMCERVDCQAMHQPQVYDLGKVTCSSILEYLFTSYMYILYMHVKPVSQHFRNEAHILYRRFKSIILTSFFKVFFWYICMIISWQCPTSTVNWLIKTVKYV